MAQAQPPLSSPVLSSGGAAAADRLLLLGVPRRLAAAALSASPSVHVSTIRIALKYDA